MDTREQILAREDKVRLVGTILDRAGLARLYDTISVAEAERMADALLAARLSAGSRDPDPVLRILSWCQDMRHERAPGAVKHDEGWDNALHCVSTRIKREFGL